ncbi:MAG: methyl-accepting chemotaxis protein [Spirochaetota bacterium]
MLARYRNYFLSSYDSENYLLRTRARLLLYFLSAFVFLSFLLQFSMLFAGWKDFVVTIPMTALLLGGLSTALVFLRKGRYLAAANIFIAFSAVAVVAGLIRQPYMEIELSLTSYIYFIFPCIVMCAVFSDIFFLTVISAVMAATNTALFIIMRSLPHQFSDKLVTIAFTNTLFAIGFLYLMSYLLLKVFERSVELANDESRKNAETNVFIRHVLVESSLKVVEAMESMSRQSDEFSEGAHDQASSIARITGTAGEISGGIDRIAENAKDQLESLRGLIGALDELSGVIDGLDGAINESLAATREITGRAQNGENHLRTMEEGIRKINESSHEMTGIIGIINDISDKINLLSLNAAIEAARAGDAGRGFAVVADEISKLADRTASSIKSIEELIRNNETEISRGLSGSSLAVGVIKEIIEGIGRVGATIAGLDEFKRRQMETNRQVNESALLVRGRSEEISGATVEQRSAVAEIVKSMSDMSARSQNSTAYAVKMAYDSGRLVDMVNGLKKTIEEYGEGKDGGTTGV